MHPIAHSALTVLALSSTPFPLLAQEGGAPPAQDPPPILARFKPESGKVQVRDLATIELPDGWQYLQQQDARTLVEKVWGNPPDPSVIGFVAPPDFEHSHWGIIVSHEDDGHVKDSDAAGLDYDDMLATMKSDSAAENKERRQAGYPTVDLRGWAEPPHYDSGEKKLYWAKHLHFEGDEGDTLNYNVRVLGRTGVLVMNAVADMRQLPDVAAGCKQVLAATAFVPGKRYSDFDSSIDKVAAYGIGGLVAGKLLLKTGILAKLLKPLLIGAVLIGGFLWKLLGGRKAPRPAQAGDPGQGAGGA